jgi:hypothetical protein
VGQKTLTEQFKVDFQWLAREYGSPAERVTLAELAIAAGSLHATELEDLFAKTIRPTARLSAFHLAQWFAANWWRLRWEPEADTLSWRMSHLMGASGGGYLWPDLEFSSIGSAVRIHSQATSADTAQPVRYLNSFDVYIGASEFERAVDEFIEAVLARLVNEGVDEGDLAALWKEVREERREPRLSAWRKLEAMMGFDPDEAPDPLIEDLEERAARWGVSAIEELAAASKEKASSDLELLLHARCKSAPVRVPDLNSVRQRIGSEVEPSAYPWARAAQAAEIARKVWSIKEGPVPDAKLSELFEISKRDVQRSEDGSDVPMAAGFRGDDGDDRLKVFLKKRHPTGRRFALARLIGDHLIAAEKEQILPATNAKTERQQFQRAFSQEFLCPFSKLADFLGPRKDNPTDDDIEDAADHFDVSPLLIKTTLVNRGYIDRNVLIAA